MNLSFLGSRVGKIIADVGLPMILRKQLPSEYNPYEEQGDPGFAEHACQGVITSPRRSRKYGGVEASIRKYGGTEELAQMHVLLRADNLLVEPAPGDKLVVSGEEWTVMKNDKVSPAGKAVLHKLELRP